MTPLLYSESFADIQKKVIEFNVIYAILAYVTLLLSLYFICRPLSTTYKNKKYSWLAYSIVGFVIYAVYNFTNGAVFSEYSYKLSMIDIAWGTSVYSLLGYIDTNF